MVGADLPVLRCEAIWKRYQGVRALADVSLQIRPKAVTAITGPNGSGKTTLLNILSGFTQPSSGRVLWGPDELTGLSAMMIARRGIVRSFQHPQLASNLTVEDHLALANGPRARESIAHALIRRGPTRAASAGLELAHRLGLRNVSTRVCELSVGQQKLLGLLLVFLSGARIMLLDEPTAGIDAVNREAVVSLLREAQERTIVVVEHDLKVFGSMIQNVVYLEDGKINPHRSKLWRRGDSIS